MSDPVCISCRGTKTVANCGACEGPLCKACVIKIEAGSFAFMSKTPSELTHTRYCRYCYDDKITPALEEYQEVLEKAKNVFVFFTTQRKSIPLISKSKEVLTVEACPDRDETILRLGFFAAELGFNAIIEVNVTAKKIRSGSYQTSEWSGTGVPAQVDEGKIDRDHLREKMYR